MGRRQIPAVNPDLYSTQASVLLITAGFFVIGFSDNLPLLIVGLIIFSLGSFAHFTARSFVASLVEPSQLGTMYMSFTVLEVLQDVLEVRQWR